MENKYQQLMRRSTPSLQTVETAVKEEPQTTSVQTVAPADDLAKIIATCWAELASLKSKLKTLKEGKCHDRRKSNPQTTGDDEKPFLCWGCQKEVHMKGDCSTKPWSKLAENRTGPPQ